MRTKAPETLYIRAPKLNQFTILQQLASDPRLTQAGLAARCNLSVAMINNYMKELCALGLLEYRRKSSRSVSYHITEAGLCQIESIRQDLIQEMAELYAGAKHQIQELVLGKDLDNLHRVVLFGNGQLAELTLHALESADVNVIGVCTDDPVAPGREWCGRAVLNPTQIRYLAPDAVVVADLDRSEEICRSIGYLAERGIRLVRLNGANGSAASCLSGVPVPNALATQ